MAYLSIRKMDERSGKLTVMLVRRSTESKRPYCYLKLLLESNVEVDSAVFSYQEMIN